MEFAVEANSIHTKTFLESLMPSMIQQLGLECSRRAVLIKVTNDIPDDMEGATYDIEVADCYLVIIRPVRRKTPSGLIAMAAILAHEMVHVRQLAKGIMKFSKNDSRIWRGKRFSKKTPYLEQPWEIDAFTRSELILRRSLES